MDEIRSLVDRTVIAVSAEFRYDSPSGEERSTPGVLVYDPARPWEAAMDFRTGSGLVRWALERDMLRDGLRRPVGLDAVRITPGVGTGVVTVSFRLASETVVVKVSARIVAAFLDRSYAIVPEGVEATLVDFDAGLARLTRDA